MTNNISELEKRLITVETNYDGLEQYSRCSDLRFHGIDESDNDNTTAKVIAESMIMLISCKL